MTFGTVSKLGLVLKTKMTFYDSRYSWQFNNITPLSVSLVHLKLKKINQLRLNLIIGTFTLSLGMYSIELF